MTVNKPVFCAFFKFQAFPMSIPRHFPILMYSRANICDRSCWVIVDLGVFHLEFFSLNKTCVI